LACGTGACASVLASIDKGYCDRDTDINVISKGGVLTVRVTDDGVFMTGDCHLVFSGVIEI
jgi:diaminopimelate epimerase